VKLYVYVFTFLKVCYKSKKHAFLRFYRTAVHNAVLRLHVAPQSVRSPFCPSVCDVGGSGSHSLEILETNCTDN